MDKDKIEEYRQKLLGGLTSSTSNKRDLQADQSEDEQLDIKFNVGFGEDIGKKVIKEKKKREQEEEETAWEKYQRKKKEKAELELLLGDKNNGKFQGEFKANIKDKRFDAILKDKAFALDPTNRNFRKIAEGEFVKE